MEEDYAFAGEVVKLATIPETINYTAAAALIPDDFDESGNFIGGEYSCDNGDDGGCQSLLPEP